MRRCYEIMSYLIKLMIAGCSDVPWSVERAVDLSTFGALRAGIPNRESRP